MKKFLTLLLAFVMVCSLVACGEQNNNSNTQDNTQQEQTQQPSNTPNGSQSSNNEESSDQTHQETMSDEWGLSMDILFKTATEFDIVFTHSSIEATVNGTLTTSPEYEIKVIYNDEIISFHDYMTKVLGKTYADATPTWDTVLYTIPTDETFKIDAILNVRDENGGLPLGEYVLCKPVTLTTNDGEKIKKIFTEEFAVVEDTDVVKKVSDTTGTTTLELSEANACELVQIIENGEWSDDVTKTISDYKLILGDRTIYYNSQNRKNLRVAKM